MKKYTIKDIMALRPCYTRKQVKRLWKDAAGLDLFEILALPIPVEDTIWGVCRLLDNMTLRLFVCTCAENALNIERASGHETDKRSWEAIEVARRYVLGEATNEELAKAYDAASAVYDSDYNTYTSSLVISCAIAATAAASTLASDAADVSDFEADIARAAAFRSSYDNSNTASDIDRYIEAGNAGDAAAAASRATQLSILYALVQQREEQQL